MTLAEKFSPRRLAAAAAALVVAVSLLLTATPQPAHASCPYAPGTASYYRYCL